ncbi:NADAR family protein [Neolewinella antarctica]|uniref:NADAR domain-containing protein n=1 Tax=Neolewinella antarctica TaxID=442734 RepID=A0ABX0X8T2_9BACT|nr:NADAR family protein [Neolewinella antarctica]NJC25666.1 hypothetical protein [Neolewinella antarctica]
MATKKLADQEILGSNSFFVSRRDISDFSFEEKLNSEVATYNIGGLLRKRIARNGGQELFTCFSETDSTLSQHHPCTFKGSVFTIINRVLLPVTFSEEHTYSSTQQFLLHNKALLFMNIKAAENILKSNDPQEQQRIGGAVTNFDPPVWKYARSEIVLRGNRLKFSQNDELAADLLATAGKTLVNASVKNKIWGAGLAASDSLIQDRDNWPGLNLLGEVLTEIRDEMLG